MQLHVENYEFLRKTFQPAPLSPNVSLLKNPMECYCCAELEERQRALEDEIVVKEVALQLAGTRYKTKQKRKYNVLATDEA